MLPWGPVAVLAGVVVVVFTPLAPGRPLTALGVLSAALVSACAVVAAGLGPTATTASSGPAELGVGWALALVSCLGCSAAALRLRRRAVQRQQHDQG